MSANRLSAIPRLSQMRATGISRICGGSRLPASMTSRIARLPGMWCRLSANAAHVASSSEKNTVKTVTMTLFSSAPPARAPVKTVMKPSKPNECGHEPRPFAVMSENERNATSTTKTMGAIQMSDTGVMITWKSQEPRRRGRRRTGAGAADGAVASGVRGSVVMSVLLPRCADQVADDEDDREQEDHDGDGGAVGEVHGRERGLVHVRRQQLRRVVGPAAGHRPDDVEGAERVDDRDREDDRVDAAHLRHDDPPEALPARGAVHRRGLL